MIERQEVVSRLLPGFSAMQPMKRLGLCIAILACFLPAASAQRSHGYLFVGPSGISGADVASPNVHVGAGGELVLPRGVGLGGEIGRMSDSS